jgi:quercetin dioxygenase-like cupin family protein
LYDILVATFAGKRLTVSQDGDISLTGDPNKTRRSIPMKHVRWVSGCILSIAFLVLASSNLRAQDMVTVAPKNCKVLLDNDRVRVIRVVMKPGEKLEMHSHLAHVVYSLTGGKMKYTSPDGKSEEREIKAGETRWGDAVTHANENIGTTETRALVVELKK